MRTRESESESYSPFLMRFEGSVQRHEKEKQKEIKEKKKEKKSRRKAEAEEKKSAAPPTKELERIVTQQQRYHMCRYVCADSE